MNTRHAIIAGRSPHDPLTELGIQQSEKLADYLHSLHIVPTQVYASPALRAKQTAAVVLRRLNMADMTVLEAEELHEMDQGSHVGSIRSEILTEELLQQRKLLGTKFKLPGSDTESMQDVADRLQEWMVSRPSTEMKNNGYTFVFSHGMAIATLTGRLLGWNHDDTLASIGNNTSFTMIAAGSWEVGRIAAAPHLE